MKSQYQLVQIIRFLEWFETYDGNTLDFNNAFNELEEEENVYIIMETKYKNNFNNKVFKIIFEK